MQKSFDSCVGKGQMIYIAHMTPEGILDLNLCQSLKVASSTSTAKRGWFASCWSENSSEQRAASVKCENSGNVQCSP